MKQNKPLLLCSLLLIVSFTSSAQAQPAMDYTAQSHTLRSDAFSKSVLVSSERTDKIADLSVIGAASLKEGDKGLEYRSLLQFDLTSLPPDVMEDPSLISSVQLLLYAVPVDFRESDESKPAKFIVRRVLGSWEDSATLWNNQPDADQQGETIKLVKVQNKDGQVSINVTKIFRDMIRKGNNGFMLCPYSSPEETLASGQLFASPKNENKELRPVLVVNYWQRQPVIIITSDAYTTRSWNVRPGVQRYTNPGVSPGGSN